MHYFFCETFMLDNKDVKIQNIYTKETGWFDADKPGKILVSPPTPEEEVTIEKFGRVIGTALYFYGKRQLTQEEEEARYKGQVFEVSQECRLLVAVPGAPHDYLLSYLSNSEMQYCSVFDNVDTRYGFFTDKNYFVDRFIAAKLYKEFLKNEKREQDLHKLENVYSLNSYHVNWNIIQ